MEKETYRIQYVDNTYQLVELTEDELKTTFRTMAEGKSFILVSKSIFKLTDIRAIVHLEKAPEPETETTDNHTADENGIVITETGTFERELYDLLVSTGIDVGEVITERSGN